MKNIIILLGLTAMVAVITGCTSSQSANTQTSAPVHHDYKGEVEK
jgi:hypothetical protein